MVGYFLEPLRVMVELELGYEALFGVFQVVIGGDAVLQGLLEIVDPFVLGEALGHVVS